MWREHLRMAARALRAHGFRSSLTVSSIMLGAFSIVLMMSLASSGLTTLVRDIESLGGAQIILIMPKKPDPVPGRPEAPRGELTRGDRDALFEALPHTVERTVYASLGGREAINARGTTVRTDLVAADAGFFSALGLRLASGRLYTDAEDRRHARVCVVAHRVAERLFEGQAVGRWMTMDGERCQIVGQLAPVDHWDSNFGFEWLDFVAMPLESLAETRPEVRTDSQIQLRTDGVASNDIVKRVANAILGERHRGVGDYEIWDFNSFMAQFHTIFAVMEAVVGLIAGIALFVGGIGVMNMMLVSVSERTREIGILKALGASPSAIAQQFLWEATVLSGAGGLAGAGAGVAAAIAVNLGIQSVQASWVGEVSVPAVVVSIAVCLLVGVGFGFFPAQRAGRLDPVEAMRR